MSLDLPKNIEICIMFFSVSNMKEKDLLEQFKECDFESMINDTKAYLYFRSLMHAYQPFQEGIANENNFFDNTIAIFNEVDKPNRKPDYESLSGSRYWYKKDGIIRGSNHWGSRITNCSWALKYKNGKTEYGHSAYASKSFTSEKYGFAKWSDFILKSEIVDINGKEILTTFSNKIGRDQIRINKKIYTRKITITWEEE